MAPIATASPDRGPAIVTTLRNAGSLLDDFIAYHRAIGFQRLYLIFDDPADPDLTRVADVPGVRAIACDETLRRAWREVPAFAEMGGSVDQEVMARQVLNAALALRWARADGHDWLLHIDVDELFHPPGVAASTWFASLADQPFDVISFPNLEAVPESDLCPLPMRNVSLFKTSIDRMRQVVEPNPALADVLRRSRRFGAGFFNLYSNGKSAARLSNPMTEPMGVHDFGGPGSRRVVAGDATILHYACCGLDAFKAKYRLLGNFSDRWWGRYDIAAAIGPFHLQARDVVLRGTDDQIAAFYRERMSMGADEAEWGLRAGLLERISSPARLIGMSP